jgi:tetratricopeptide (TPR) repeat protein
LGVILVPGVLGLGWLIEASLYGRELAKARAEMQSGRLIAARSRLDGLSQWPLKRGEALVLRGDCELALGKPKEAIASWSTVPPRSAWWGEASVRIARALMTQGKLAEAEVKVAAALHEPGSHTAEARKRMIVLLKFEGRLREVRSLIEEGWQPGSSPVDVLRQLWELDDTIYPIDGVRDFLDRAGRLAPEEERVWLAKANLATRVGAFDEAQRWLDQCLTRRAEDPVVWRSRLDWAIAADRPELAARCLSHVPARAVTLTDRHTVRAWFAAKNGDRLNEREALEALANGDSRQASALERLAEIAAQTGETSLAAELRGRKIAFAKELEDYKALLYAPDPLSKARELAGLAQALGRTFDARCWWTVIAEGNEPARREARRALARLDGEKRADLPSQTLADLLADVLPKLGGGSVALASALRIPTFTDDAQTAGLRFTFDNGKSPARQLPETMSGGLALLDYDGDGLIDVYAVQGGSFPPDAAPRANEDRLFRNQGHGVFLDVSAAARLTSMTGGYGHGVAVGDIDNDGDTDVFVTRFNSYALYRNRGDGTFEDITESAGLSGDRDWPTSAAFADLDNDGDLDLYVCHYLVWDPNLKDPCPTEGATERFYCHPRLFKALPDHLFRNDNGKFVDVTESAGIVDREGRGLGVLAADLDCDGLVDLFVANDTTENYYFHNLGGMKFEEIAGVAGVAANGSGTFQAGMGIALGDQNGDGLLDLAVTNFYAEGTTLFANLGKNMFFDHSMASGLLATSRSLLGFGVAFLDANNDGRLDLAAANGHVNDGRPRLPYAMPARLWLGAADAKLVDVSDRAGEPWKIARVGRGLATGDLDNDGRADVVILSQNEPLAYFHNMTSESARFVILRLEGMKSNRDAVGARIKITAGGKSQFAQRFGGGSYQSASDPRIHIGLGAVARLESIEVIWPSGQVDRFFDLAADRGYLLREGEPQPQPLAGFPEPSAVPKDRPHGVNVGAK